MSSMYITEPPTSGKVLLHTTFGDLDVELWSKECPRACRNFFQLCMEGYYDNTVFHRLVKDFMMQGGDPTGTGTGGVSSYGRGFKDEIHSRLRFSHRGLLAMANASAPNTNQSQFFLTLGECTWLHRKHTIFAKVTGKTVFNLMRCNDYETDSDDRPLDPPRILSAEVLNCPFDDIVPRATKKAEVQNEVAKPKRKKKKRKKNLSLLSFGEEAATDEQKVAESGGGMKSSHDVLRGSDADQSAAAAVGGEGTTGKWTRPQEAVEDGEQGIAAEADAMEAMRAKKAAALKLRAAVSEVAKVASRKGKEEKPQTATTLDSMFVDEHDTEAARVSRSKAEGVADTMRERMKQKLMKQKKRRKVEKPKAAEDMMDDAARKKKKEIEDRKRRREQILKIRGELSQTRKKKRAVHVTTGAKQEAAMAAQASSDLLSPLEQMRRKYLQRKKKHGRREQTTMERLKSFRSKLTTSTAQAPPDEVVVASTKKSEATKGYSGEVDREDDEGDDKGWMTHKLKFVKHWEDGLRGFKPVADDYVTIDPLQGKQGDKATRGRGTRNKRAQDSHVPQHLRK